MYFSDSSSSSSSSGAGEERRAHRRVLSFQFRVPPHPMDMARLMELVPRYIEVVGRLRLSEKARAKSVKNRQKAEEQKLKDQAHEAQCIKKQDKRDAKAAALEAMTPKAREKQEEKDRKKALQKSNSKMKISKAH
mmetsp:Transcript_768/g.1371  ORF Transcript_768/g.1371 Transcript_768/m.1371 type:complete len:135 (-) Transcript_768:335-739(-)